MRLYKNKKIFCINPKKNNKSIHFIRKKEGIIMSKLVDEAVETLRIANDKMAQLSDAFCENAKTEPLGKPYLAYEISTLLQMYLSQMSGEEKFMKDLVLLMNKRKR